MTLRLVLVSMVAALGLSLPSSPMIESWVASTQSWMNARFADWDTRNPAAADYVIVSDLYDPALVLPAPSPASRPAPIRIADASLTPTPRGSESSRLAVRPVSFVREIRTLAPMEPSSIEASLPLSVFAELSARHDSGAVQSRAAASRPRFEPLVVEDLLQTGIAFELNRKAQGIGIMPPPVAVAATPTPTPLVTLPLSFAALEEVLNLDLMKERVDVRPPVSIPLSFAALEEVPNLDFLKVRPEARPMVSTPLDFAALEESPSLYFAGELPVAKAATVPPAVPQLVPSPRRRVEPIAETEDLAIEVAGELIPLDDGFRTWTKSAISTPVAAVRTLSPLPSSPSLLGGLAVEVNRLAMQAVLAHPRPLVPADAVASTPLNPPSLTQAVRLTRDAVHAWVNVLMGPAIVTVSHTQ